MGGTRSPSRFTHSSSREALRSFGSPTTYTWTPSGDLLTREDLLHDQHETFEHDALHRLTETDVTQGPAQLVQSVTYNEFGDIRTKSDVGSYLYQGTTGRLLRYGSPQTVLAYDQNGRVTARGDQTLDYTAQGKVATLDGPGVSLEMIYDADGQRVGRHDSANGGMVVTLDGVYERRFPDGLGEHRARYLAPLPSGSAIRVERTWDGGPAFSEATHFVHSDYLGSGEVVTDITGAVLAEASFDPWGAARDPEDWTNVLSEPALVELGVGFTGHRAELDGGLVNMGGRMYDPQIGRFMSRDPIIADPANGQTYNRYSYVSNRPLRLVDPTGYRQEDPIEEDEGEGGDGDAPGSPSDGTPDFDGSFHQPDDPHDSQGGSPWWTPIFWNGNGQGSPAPDSAESRRDACGGLFPGRGCYEQALDDAGTLEFWSDYKEKVVHSRMYEVAGWISFGSIAALGVGILAVSQGGWLLRSKDILALGGRAGAAGAAGRAATGGARPVRIGQQGEAAVREAVDIGPKELININGRNRIPDGLRPEAVSEVKNASRVWRSRQIRDLIDFAVQTGRRLDLYVRPGARVSNRLRTERVVNIIDIPF